jgi:uncharacterized protein DUF4214
MHSAFVTACVVLALAVGCVETGGPGQETARAGVVITHCPSWTDFHRAPNSFTYTTTEVCSRSARIRSYVGNLYDGLLEREPDDGGLAFWTSTVQQAAGTPGCGDAARNVARAFLQSSEYVTLSARNEAVIPPHRMEIDDLYMGLLGRFHDEGGLAYWTGVADASGMEPVIEAFVASTELEQRLTATCDPTDFSALQPAPSCDQVKAAAAHLQYFGFYCSSCDWVGNGTYTDELRGFVNLVHVASNDFGFIRRELQRAQDDQLSAMVDGRHIQESIESGRLAWSDWIPLLQPFVDSGTLRAFYVADDTFGDPFTGQVSPPIERNIQRIKATFPRVAIAAIITGVPWTVPSEIDWIGFEQYSGYDPGSIATLSSVLGPDQRQILVPNRQADLAAVAGAAIRDPKVVAVMPFLWQEGGAVVYEPDGTAADAAYRDDPPSAAMARTVGACFK